MKNKIVLTLFLSVILIATFYIVKGSLIRISFQDNIRDTIGFRIGISKVVADSDNKNFKITGFKILNPQGYNKRELLYANLLELKDVVGKNVGALKMNVGRIIIEKNNRGKINIINSKVFGAKAENENVWFFKKVAIKVDEVVYVDYFKGNMPDRREFEVDIDQTYYNVHGIDEIYNIIMARIMAITTISSIAEVDIEKIDESIPQRLKEKVLSNDRDDLFIGKIKAMPGRQAYPFKR